ncbi:MAG: hypothetical protein RIE22_05910 [Alphaproteobacteria bacterium]
MLSKRSKEILIDLIEIKLGYLECHDREDAREKRALETCLSELRGEPAARDRRERPAREADALTAFA